MRLILKTLLLAGVLLLTSGNANGVDEKLAAAFLDKRYSFWLGGFFPEVDSSIRLDKPNGEPGDTIDFEETLGLEDGKSVLFGGARWRFNRRHQLEGEIIDLSRSSLLEGASEDLDIGDYEVRVGARIESEFDVTVARLTYGYAVVETEKNSVNLKAGLHVARFKTLLRLSGNVLKDGVPIEDGGFSFVDEGADITAPLPHLGVSWGYAISDRFGIRAQGLLFAFKIDDWQGSLVDLGFDAQFHPWRRFGIGAGIRYFKTTLENKDKDRTFGEFVYEYYGPVVYGVFSF
ncbi:MAG: hypothetical protein HKN81_07710 [Gammaproteobacteria bacterium]|nr:hypothetical protein [Gammaproteobacteria bacterium]NND37006.1 hypothetical protein [Gammaproteobacteria bacterium]